MKERERTLQRRDTQRALIRLRTSSRIQQAFGNESSAVTYEISEAERAITDGNPHAAAKHITKAGIEQRIDERFQLVFGENYDKR